MSLFDRLFVGKVFREFDVVSERSLGLGTERLSVLVSQRGGRYRLYFKIATRLLLGFRVSYVELTPEAVPRLVQTLHEAEAAIASAPTP